MAWIIHYHGKNTSMDFQTHLIYKPHQVYELMNDLGTKKSLEFDYIEELKE